MNVSTQTIQAMKMAEKYKVMLDTSVEQSKRSLGQRDRLKAQLGVAKKERLHYCSAYTDTQKELNIVNDKLEVAGGALVLVANAEVDGVATNGNHIRDIAEEALAKIKEIE